MSVQASIQMNLTVKETLTVGVDASSNPIITHNAFNVAVSPLNSGTTPAATKVSADNQALTAGAYTLDLTACALAGGTTQSLTGLKICAYMFRAPSTNTGVITITKGASTGHTIGTNWKETLYPGQSVLKYLSTTAPETIDATHKFLDVTGTLAETFDYEILAG